MIDVVHLGKAGSPETCFLANLHAKSYINPSLPGNPVSQASLHGLFESRKEEAEDFCSGEK